MENGELLITIRRHMFSRRTEQSRLQMVRTESGLMRNRPHDQLRRLVLPLRLIRDLPQ